jgi:hypothetical protein
MNKYYFAFLFKGKFEFVSFTSVQLANSVLPKFDDILNAVCLDDDQVFMQSFIAEDSLEYNASWEQPGKLSIYQSDKDGGVLVEKDVPFLLLKITNKEGKVIYNLSDNV